MFLNHGSPCRGLLNGVEVKVRDGITVCSVKHWDRGHPPPPRPPKVE